VFENYKKKVSFNIASEESYVYILNGQKLIKNAKKKSFWRIFDSVTRQVSFNRTKIGGKRQNSQFQMRHFQYFSNSVRKGKEGEKLYNNVF